MGWIWKGISIGIGIFLGALIFYLCCRKRKRRGETIQVTTSGQPVQPMVVPPQPAVIMQPTGPYAYNQPNPSVPYGFDPNLVAPTMQSQGGFTGYPVQDKPPPYNPNY